ncbi:MAG: hypothetical protein CL881_03775 [Dehalococcoidia bacterium]|nr:hypothetical protein [Dehalococcoidia bacterium]
MSTTLYDLASANEQKKIESDIIYNILMNKETTLLDRLLTEIIDTTKKNHTDMSKRYHSMTERCIKDNSRIAKHGLFFFGLYLCPTFAESLIKPDPKVNPIKFSIFYNTILPQACTKLLNGEYSCLQEFVEDIRLQYVICNADV